MKEASVVTGMFFIILLVAVAALRTIYKFSLNGKLMPYINGIKTFQSIKLSVCGFDVVSS